MRINALVFYHPRDLYIMDNQYQIYEALTHK